MHEPVERIDAVIVNSSRLELAGGTYPVVSQPNSGIMVYDVDSNKFMVSQNGNAYVDLVPGAGNGDVVVRNASTSLTTASYSFGFNSATYNNVVADATHTEINGATIYTILTAKAGATRGAAGDLFKVLMNVLQGGAATTTIDVYGYLF